MLELVDNLVLEASALRVPVRVRPLAPNIFFLYKMPRILFTWEFGAGFGHLTRDLPLARVCRDAGHDVVFVVSNLRTAAKLLYKEGFSLFQAPLLRPENRQRPLPINYADMLMYEGFDDTMALDGALSSWCALFELVRPDLIVYNHAPTALLAARAIKIPVITREITP